MPPVGLEDSTHPTTARTSPVTARNIRPLFRGRLSPPAVPSPAQRRPGEDGSMRTHRRQFLKTAAGFGAALAANAYAGGNDEIRVGLVGCGGRGTGAAVNCLEADAGVKIVALGDAFKDRLESCQAALKQRSADRASPPPARCFVGLDAYKQVIGAGADVVLLATPGAFRPHPLLAAVAAGKHVFAEKPLAVDATGVRRVLAAGA